MLKRGNKTKYFLIITLFFYIILCNTSLSQSISEIKDKIQQTTESRRQLEKEISLYESQLKDIGSQADSLNNAIKTLDITIKKNSADIKLTQNNIKKTELEINKLSSNIDKSVDTINQNSKVIAEMINETNKADDSTFIENLLVYDNVSEFWNEMESLYKIQNKMRDTIDKTRVVKKDLEIDKDVAVKEKKELLKYQAELTDKKKILDISKKEKNQLLADTKNQESSYKNMLAVTKAKQEALDKEIGDYESQLKLIIDPKSYPSPKNGILSWPLSNIYITQKFGITSDSGRLYQSGSHNGADFRASVGTNLMSVAPGVVDGVGDTDKVCPKASYGQWVLIKHNNGLSSLYAHLSYTKVKKGDKVSTGSLIGYSGNTGYSTGPHLHFGLFATQGVEIKTLQSKVCNGVYTMPIADTKAYLDPLAYLPKI
ncbi:MAG: peptidoglycan DD-metalloendopeptidase family protein [Candidatus Pacebacteria bacterium]|nr:peptidoglycan DD-metalloendopeptidase family protein [Candidatus Paceibacterota bacterium]